MKQTNHSAAMRNSQLQLCNSIGTLERCYLAIFVCAFTEPISFEEKLSRLKRYVRIPSGAKLRPIAWKIARYLFVIFRNYNSKRRKSALVEPRSGQVSLWILEYINKQNINVNAPCQCLEIARRRFRKFNSKYIESIKIARPIFPPRDTNFPH
jgi:hypothetical protein